MEGEKLCPFAKLGICRLGSNCKYLHPPDTLSLPEPSRRLQHSGRHEKLESRQRLEPLQRPGIPQKPGLPQRPGPPHRPGLLQRPEFPERMSENRHPQEPRAPSVSNTEREFQTWRRNIPLETHTIRPLRARMSAFVQEARRLIETNAGNLQSVVRSLASEGGLSRIQELVEQNFSTMPPAMKLERFRSQILPLLEIASHPDVLSSLILEQAVGTIYNVLYGRGGSRAVGLFTYVGDVLEIAKNDIDFPEKLEVSCHVFSLAVELNSEAPVQSDLKVQAKRIHDLLVSTHGTNSNYGNRYLDRLLYRFEIGSSMPTASEPKLKFRKTDPSFVVAHEPPGGRHNNDHVNICDIRIMPTYREITCERAEYLPTTDPTQWHVDGVQGLLDRNFRLLREDTIGQLRDAIHFELQPSSSGHRAQQRTLNYHDARITHLGLDPNQGFYFEVQFPQPWRLKTFAARERQIWWQMSKRLQPGALVCSILPGKSVIFCTVTELRRSKKTQASEATNEMTVQTLWNDNERASVLLHLVDQRSNIIQSILDQYSRKALPMSLVEFPGVVLPAFEPTLRALQSISESQHLPLSDLLLPADSSTGGKRLIPPPAYALKRGFAFNLRCLMKNGKDFHIHAGQPVDVKYLQENSTLDRAQAEALAHSLQHRIGIIQGPPGTGKSYTGVAIIKVLLANRVQGKTRLGPIICVTYTNHALDQLLEALIEKEITSQIVRIGSRSKSERLQPFNIRNVAQNIDRTRLEKSSQWALYKDLQAYTKEFEALGLRDDITATRLQAYLRENHYHHYAGLFGEDEDGYQIVTNKDPQVAINKWLQDGSYDSPVVRSIDDLEMVSPFQMCWQERQALYKHWAQEIIADMHDEVIQLTASYAETKSEFDDIRDEVNLRCLNQAHIIGLTTSGLARNLSMLRNIQSKVVLCEEAGEVLEAHLLTALLPSVEHTILIGDHLQLRPQIQNYELSRENPRGGEKYSLDVSLFERLVDSDSAMGSSLPFSTLETQRRMHPSIAQLVRDTLYPQLSDDPSVADYPEVVGMRKRLFWLDHRVPESDAGADDAMATSHWNQHEIDMTVGLVSHLVRQGKYHSSEIAVLTPYLGQLHRLRQILGRSFAITLGEQDQEDLDKAGFEDGTATGPTIRTTLLRTLRVATIDNFQGEEAKVVIISLVRSNPQNRCGFLRTPNRINVLLSRAQHGMYIIGNSTTSEHVPMWANVLEILRRNGNIGPALELQCPRHPDTPICVSEPDDFTRVSPEGGCNLRCVHRLTCGHACIQKCHSHILHSAVYCLERCQRPLKGCTHECPKKCGDACPKQCTVNVFQEDRALECGHVVQNLPCWQSQNLKAVRCTVVVQKEVPNCHHTINVACHIDVASLSFQCGTLCGHPLPCAHTCKRRCNHCTRKDLEGKVKVDHGACTQQCGRKQSTCAHVCVKPCHGSEPCPPCSEPCDVHCGHSKCMGKCSEPCPPCAVETCLSTCPHSSCTMLCAAPCDNAPCSRRCPKLLTCGHQCPSVCGEKCPPTAYCQKCASEELQDQEVDFMLGQTYKDINLDENPCIFPSCGHFLTMESMDAQMDMARFYTVDAEGMPVAIKGTSEPFSINDIKSCAHCRGSLRDIARYGRLVRRALLDESTKKLIIYLNSEYVPLAQEVPQKIQHLHDARVAGELPWPATIIIAGSRDHQCGSMAEAMRALTPGRWKAILEIRWRVKQYCQRAAPSEQPFNRVRNMVESARRRNKTDGTFDFDNNILQTKGLLQGMALGIRLDLALLADFLDMEQMTSGTKRPCMTLQLDETKADCHTLIQLASDTNRLLQKTEGYIFLAQLLALERSKALSLESGNDLRNQCRAALEEARSLCRLYPAQTRGLLAEVDGVEKMLDGFTFYTAVTNEERMTVIQAMAREFHGTGHWYYCRYGHPFTIGECGGPMEQRVCPECGEPVGGRDHQAAEGVTRASNLEREFGEMLL